MAERGKPPPPPSPPPPPPARARRSSRRAESLVDPQAQPEREAQPPPGRRERVERAVGVRNAPSHRPCPAGRVRPWLGGGLGKRVRYCSARVSRVRYCSSARGVQQKSKSRPRRACGRGGRRCPLFLLSLTSPGATVYGPVDQVLTNRSGPRGAAHAGFPKLRLRYQSQQCSPVQGDPRVSYP